MPLAFEQNRGQTDEHVRFLVRAGGGTIFLTDDGLVLASGQRGSSRFIRMRLVDAKTTKSAGELATGGFANYYRSNQKEKWLSRVPLFAKVRYAGVYPGIDAVFHGHEDELEYDCEAAPGSSPERITFRFEGAERISPTRDGGLEIMAGQDLWHFLPPVAYQMHDGIRKPVQAGYRLMFNDTVTVKLGNYDRSGSLIIDPVVHYANLLSPNNRTDVSAIQVDTAGNLIIAGQTLANDYPVVNGQGPKASGAEQVYLTKLNPAGALRITV